MIRCSISAPFDVLPSSGRRRRRESGLACRRRLSRPPAGPRELPRITSERWLPDHVYELSGIEAGAEDFLAAVLRAAAQPIWVVDPDGLIRFANPAAVAALGYDSPGELLGRHSHETIHYKHPDGSPYPAAECPMLLPRTTGETITSDLDWFFRRDGSMFPVSYASVPIEMHDGRGAVVAFTDIAPRLEAEKALRERDAMLTEQQASLRRVAALVGGGAASGEVFAAVAREVAQVLRLPLVVMSRYESDDTAAVIGAYADRPHPFVAGTRWPLDGPTISAHSPRDRTSGTDRRLPEPPGHHRRRRPHGRDPLD